MSPEEIEALRAWERAGRLAWSSLTETSPESATPDLLIADAARVEATYQDGVLTVKLPRREETRPRQIQING